MSEQKEVAERLAGFVMDHHKDFKEIEVEQKALIRHGLILALQVVMADHQALNDILEAAGEHFQLVPR